MPRDNNKASGRVKQPPKSESDVSQPKQKKKVSSRTKQPPKSEKKHSVSKEKRSCRYRATCPPKLHDRLIRATTQRLYLIQQALAQEDSVPNSDNSEVVPRCVVFTVLGSTGNVYTVELKHKPSCDCPDFARNKDLCKHIIFVLLKVIGVPADNPLAFQKAYVTSELNELIAMLNDRRVGGGREIDVMANDRVRANYASIQSSNGKRKGNVQGVGNNDEDSFGGDNGEVQRRSLDNNDDDCDCPVCFDRMDPNDKMNELTFCRSTCGTNFHADCIVKWLANCSTKSCPNCRQPWISLKKPRFNQDANYVNLASLQGMSRKRDTSTYHS